jgi:hypothetical protein
MGFYEDAKMTAFNGLMLFASEAMIVVLGVLIIYASVRAYHRAKSKSMLALSIGLSIMIIGSLVEEVFLAVFGYPIIEAHIVENFLLATGLLVIVYSLYGIRG